jgi:CRP/FNR family transcriptional regulator, cyclic AMP receptor protein
MRISAEVLEMLAAQPLFSGLSQQELRSIAALGTPVDIKAGRVLTKEGASGLEAFLIVSGTARCVIGEQEVAILGPGDLFGEMSLLDRAPRSATVVADTEMSMIVFMRSELIRLVEASPKIALKLLAAMAARLRKVDQGFVASNG